MEHRETAGPRTRPMSYAPVRVGSVAVLWRYPVKSMRGTRVPELTVTPQGSVGDRAWALRDPAESPAGRPAATTLWCVTATLAQEELPRDPSVLRTTARHHDGCLGVYAAVRRPGMVRVGDAVTLC